MAYLKAHARNGYPSGVGVERRWGGGGGGGGIFSADLRNRLLKKKMTTVLPPDYNRLAFGSETACEFEPDQR